MKIDIEDFIREELKKYFIIINEGKHKGATNYNFGCEILKGLKKSGIKCSNKIHKEIQKKVKEKFSLNYEEVVKGLKIDIWDKNNKIAYEIVLGNGDEFWKDVLKSLLIRAKKLIIFCRDYPDIVNGYENIKRNKRKVEGYIHKKEPNLDIKIINIFEKYNS